MRGHLRDGEKLLIGARLNPIVRVPLDYVVDDEETLLRLLAEHGFGARKAPNDLDRGPRSGP